ncbi:MAG: shikimate kinase [Parvibaculaceae bacterium]
MSRRIGARDIEAIRASLGARSIVLVGLMGAGKSTVGRRLAHRLSIPFIDADAEIEAAAAKTIAEIFADHGEPFFREGERKVIARLLEAGPQVLATGGGAFMNSETRENIRRNGISVWLRAGLPLLMKRVRKRQTRPLLFGDDPEGVMQRLMDERHPIYAEADITVDSRDTSHQAVVAELLRTLATRLALRRSEECKSVA